MKISLYDPYRFNPNKLETRMWRENKIFQFMVRYQTTNVIPPTIREIQRHLHSLKDGASVSIVRATLERMANEGTLETRDRGKATYYLVPGYWIIK